MNQEMKLKVHKVSLRETDLFPACHFLTPTPDQSGRLPFTVFPVHSTACKFVFLWLIVIHISVIIKFSPPLNYERGRAKAVSVTAISPAGTEQPWVQSRLKGICVE